MKQPNTNLSNNLSTNLLLNGFRNKDVILALSKQIHTASKHLAAPLKIMEVCGGHTHTLMRYGLLPLLPPNVEFIHGPGCPVCIMPKARINQAFDIAMQKDVILITLGDMLKVPGSKGSLQNARSLGADVRFVYSPMQILEIAKQNPDKKIVYFAIGFETTTPMSAAILKHCIDQNIKNVFFHINHVLVPPPLEAILSSKDCQINALIAPSHVSVIAGAKIYQPILQKYTIPIVVSGFEPVDMMQSILMIINQAIHNDPKLEIQYSRVVSFEGNTKAQEIVERFFEPSNSFEWRGLGEIPRSSLRLRDEFSAYDAQKVFANVLSQESVSDNKACRCGDILRGICKPFDCKVFGKSCTPERPLGSCMVSSEGACAAYYKYGFSFAPPNSSATS
ncbi:hydrogenase formation protein HypD [Helicobacter fennelliae]|uniref:[NiFe] hydrogenase metallocenter assembly protein HypD n=2 Tax=Helicobacter fennelliae TaxID=215 RepID=T1DWJ6_9HELI|nr:hydrogenase formation protein HypD [Helicobacter fennelliae]GAD19693.1 [NiFe] hydrogenase metallocenter assembly protein HypD [Helicobacter fennelliae MRY12-0050]SQB99612.1 hydrogenase isoenzymes formation protein [Helicobacter fennelliae]STP07264.1 hydrogenase isoenzymes formation protein [Helicobacter fennelliae]STQ85152.1 hydrogenase isoenzymes formation protein [Helicobacter fennelliae]